MTFVSNHLIPERPGKYTHRMNKRVGQIARDKRFRIAKQYEQNTVPVDYSFGSELIWLYIVFINDHYLNHD